MQIQYAAAFHSEFIETFLKDPVSFMILAHGFPLLGLFFSLFIFRNNTKIIWKRIINGDIKVDYRSIAILFTFSIAIVVIYLRFVPFRNTGLYNIIANPSSSAIAREMSLKLLDNQMVKYAYTFLMSTLSPLLAVMAFLALILNVRKKNLVGVVLLLGVFLFTIFTVSLTGARAPAAEIILICLLAWFLRKKAPINPMYVSIGAILVLFIPIFFSLMREGKDFSINLFFQYMFGGIFNRLFVVPMEVGLWHVHYAQNYGFFGVAGIPKLATLYQVEPLNVPNIIGLHYSNTTIESISANTSYVFSYYSYFGLASFLISLIGLLLLDLAVIVYQKLSDKLLLPCIATVSIASISFTASDYTTVLITHGFALLLILSIILDRVSMIKIRFDKFCPAPQKRLHSIEK